MIQEHLLESVELILRRTLRVATKTLTGGPVHIDGHLGDTAREVDVVATNAMREAVKELFPAATFAAEEVPMGLVEPSSDFQAVWIGDAVDGTRQHHDLGFGYGCAGSLHVSDAGTADWQMIGAGVVNSTGGFAGFSYGVTQEVRRSRIDEQRYVAIGASRPGRVGVIKSVAEILPPDWRVWNTAGNPAVPGLVRNASGYLVQPTPQALWDSLALPIGMANGLSAYSLAEDTYRPMSWGRIRSLFAEPHMDGKQVPPFVVGVEGRMLRKIWDASRLSIA